MAAGFNEKSTLAGMVSGTRVRNFLYNDNISQDLTVQSVL